LPDGRHSRTDNGDTERNRKQSKNDAWSHQFGPVLDRRPAANLRYFAACSTAKRRENQGCPGSRINPEPRHQA